MALKPSVGKKKQQSSYANVRAALGQSQSGDSYKTSSGATATVKSGSSYSNVQAELEKYQAPKEPEPTTTTTQTSTSPITQPTKATDTLAGNKYAAAFRGQVSVADIQSGRVAGIENVRVSRAVASKLSREQFAEKQMSGDISGTGTFKATGFVRRKTSGTPQELINGEPKTGNEKVQDFAKGLFFEGGKDIREASRFPPKPYKALEGAAKSTVGIGIKGVAMTFKGGGNVRGQPTISTDTLIALGTGLTPRSLDIGGSKVKVASKTYSKVVSSEGKSAGSGVVSGEVIVERNIFGIPLKTKKGTFTGKTSSFAEDTKSFGGVSGEPVVKLKDIGDFDIDLGGKGFKVSSVSSGGSVGGVGQRKTGFEVRRRDGGRVVSSDSLVESFITKETDDVVYGGSVTSQDVNFFANKKILERENVVSGEPVVKSSVVSRNLGIDVADPKGLGFIKGDELVLNQVITQKSGVVKTKLFEGGSVGQSDIPFSAKVTQKGIVDLLKREKLGMTKGKPVEFFKKSDVSSTGLVSKSDLVTESFNVDNILKTSLESATKPSAKLPIFVPSNNKESQSIVSTGKVDTSNVFVNQNTVRKSDLGSSPFSAIGNLGSKKTFTQPNFDVSYDYKGNIKAGLFGKSKVNSSVKTSVVSELISKQKPIEILKGKPEVVNVNILGNRQGGLLKQSGLLKQGLLYKQVTTGRFASTTPFSPRTPFVFTPKPLTPFGFGLPKKGSKGLFGVEVRRKGVFVSAGQGLKLSDAIKRGSNIVRGTSARTFRITKGSTPITSVQAGKGFYSKKGGLIIENVSDAINTGGELSEITYKGIRTNKKKTYMGLSL